MTATDTIAAIATPPGRGGIGVVRVSGAKVEAISEQLLGSLPKPRLARLAEFRAADGQPIDQGIALYFPTPNSFTGESVLELQGHGGPVVMELLLARVVELGARLARPGEFSERAFLNDKLDLVQAEAVADLIDAETQAAARLALRSLEGDFSQRIHALVDGLIHLRMYVESAIDFPEEEIDFLADGQVAGQLANLQQQLTRIRASARQGRLLRDGLNLVIAGKPNAGKSSLLNALAGYDSAIVTDVPGTTRDVLRERIQIDGLPLHVIDTAGLRQTQDQIEEEGMRRARAEIDKADLILWLFDARMEPDAPDLEGIEFPQGIPVLFVRNKIDRVVSDPGIDDQTWGREIALSAKTGQGMEQLRAELTSQVGYRGPEGGEFMARRRHLDALAEADSHLGRGDLVLNEAAAGELLAEELRLAQQALSRITGEFSADDLLGEIFSSFCIGK